MCSGASGLVAGTGSGLSEVPAGEWILYRLPPTRTSCLFYVLCPLRLGPQALPPLQATLSQEVEGLRGTRDWGLGVAVGTAGAVCWGLRYRLQGHTACGSAGWSLRPLGLTGCGDFT